MEKPDWQYRNVSESEEYGDVTTHVIENEEKRVSVRIGLSEGMHIMMCERGMWQVTLPREYVGKDEMHKCFETEDEAIGFAIRWVNSQ